MHDRRSEVRLAAALPNLMHSSTTTKVPYKTTSHTKILGYSFAAVGARRNEFSTKSFKPSRLLQPQLSHIYKAWPRHMWLETTMKPQAHLAVLQALERLIMRLSTVSLILFAGAQYHEAPDQVVEQEHQCIS